MPRTRLFRRSQQFWRPVVFSSAEGLEEAIGRSLSQREIEILRHVALGETSKEIATALGIGERTVNWHIGKAFHKLGAGSRAEAVALAMEQGIVRRPHDSRTEP